MTYTQAPGYLGNYPDAWIPGYPGYLDNYLDLGTWIPGNPGDLGHYMDNRIQAPGSLDTLDAQVSEYLDAQVPR